MKEKTWLPLLLRMEPSTKKMLKSKAAAHGLPAAAFIRKLIEDAPSKPSGSNGNGKVRSSSASKGWETRRAKKAQAVATS